MDIDQNDVQMEQSDKRKRNAIIIAAAIVICGIAGYFILKQGKSTAGGLGTKDSTGLKKDSLQVVKTSDDVTEYDEEPYGVYYMLQDVTAENHQFHVGDKVFKDYQKSTVGRAVFYISEPQPDKPITQTAYTVSDELLVTESDMGDYKKNFSLQPFVALDWKIKKLILDKQYSEGTDYSITQNADRARNTICVGDFDADGITDVAVILDNNEQQKSRLLVICTNAATKEKYLAFGENYSDKIKINSFKKGTSISVTGEASNELITAPIDGLMLTGEDLRLAIMYDIQLQKYKVLYQE